MVQKKGLFNQPSYVWENLEINLSRQSNLEEGHFVERAWASILSPTETHTYMELLSPFLYENIKYEQASGDLVGTLFLDRGFVVEHFTSKVNTSSLVYK